MYPMHERLHSEPSARSTPATANQTTRLMFAFAAVACLMSAPAIANTEPNDDPASAHDTGLAGAGTVTITGDAIDPGLLGGRSFDIDLFEFTIPAASAAAPMLVTAEALSAGSPLDAYVRLFDNSGVAIAGDDDINKDNTDARLETYVLSPGVYYVGVSSSSNSTYSFVSLPGASGITENTTTGGFELTITVEAKPAIDSSLEPNDTGSNAVAVTGPSFLAAGQFIGDGPNGRRDLDRYRISITGPTIVEAVAAGTVSVCI